MTSGMDPEPQPAATGGTAAPAPAPDPNDLVTVLTGQPRPSRRLADAIRERPVLFLAPIAIGLVLGLLAGLLRSPVYTAETRLAIARVSVSTQSLPGFAAGVQDLAVTYSRLATADDVTREAGRLLNADPDSLEGRVTGSPIPQSPLFRLEATGSSEDEAIATANATSQALRSYVARLNADNPDSERIYAAFLLAARDRVDAQRAVRSAEAAAVRRPGVVTLRRLVSAQSRAAGAALRAESLRDQYKQSIAGSGSASLVQVVNPARAATSDRGDAVQRLALLGLIGGVLVGLLLVLMWPKGEEQAYRPLHARSS